jgi:protein-tyrosine-phosphatase/DNA-binding transcriptional ArsR family regulator
MYSRAVIAASQLESPPAVLGLLGHPLRWRLVGLLARSDRRVRELRDLVGEPQSLVSYHLGQLREARLARTRRSSFDGRDTYYSIDLVRCGELLAQVGAGVHPGLRMSVTPVDVRRPPAVASVLFLCTGNSARSQMAEALLAHRGGDAVLAASAGSEPKPLHPNGVQVMRSYGIDLAGRRPKHFSTFSGRRFDVVITLCDRVREVCPDFAGGGEPMHWSLADPSREGDTDAETLPAFERTAAELDTRIGFLLDLIGQSDETRR